MNSIARVAIQALNATNAILGGALYVALQGSGNLGLAFVALAVCFASSALFGMRAAQ